MQNSVKQVAIVAFLGLFLLSTAFVGLAQDNQLVFGYSAPGLGDQGQQNIQKGFTERAEELGIEVITTNAERSAQKQVQDVETLVARGVDAICAVPFNSEIMSEGVKVANEAGVPFFTIDRGVTGGELVLTVLADNHAAGQQAGEAMLRLLQGRYNGEAKGKVLQITGQPGQNVTRLRKEGFESVVEEYPNIELITKPGNWSNEKGYQIAQDVLSNNPDLDGIYYAADLYIPGVTEAIKSVKGEYLKVGDEGHIFILGVDGNPAGLDQVSEGMATGVVVQPLRDYGHVIVPLMRDYVNEGESALPDEGLLKREGERWSPAEVVKADSGMEVRLSTYYVDTANADDPSLWGNQVE